MQSRCALVKLKPNSLDRVQEWAATLKSRADEVLQTLRDEGVEIESAFLARINDDDYLVYYARVQDVQTMRSVAKASTHPIDQYHKQFKADTWDEREELVCLIDFINREST